MNPLFMLLGQQAGVPVANSILPEENNILVQQNRGARYSPEDDPDLGTRLLGNTPAIEATGQAIQRGQEVSDRRGMFGMKGTLRDVLGVLGDAFLMQSGRSPLYAPTRRQEQISDAMAGYTDKPLEAIERVAYYDPDMAKEMKEKYETNLVRQAQQQSLEDTRQSQIEARDIAAFDRVRESLARLANNPNAYGPDGNFTPEAEAIAQRLAAGANRTLEDFDIAPGMSRTRGSLLASTGATVNQQNMLPIAQQRADASTSQARSSAVRAARPPAGRAPRAESDREAAIRIGNKPESQRTEGEKSFYEKYTRPPGRSGGRTLRSDPLGTRTTSRFGPPRN